VEHLLGVEVPRSGFVSCPFHVDRTPSFKVYETPERGWMCFSAHCRRGGSIYDLAAALWGLGTRGQDFLELRRRLLAYFPSLKRQGEDGRGGGGYASLPP
jgi:CHC2 zinc finger